MNGREEDSVQGNASLVERKDWQTPWCVLPPYLKKYPTMLSFEELRMLRWLASEYYSGEGCICDLGAFLGGSTIVLADGYLAAGHTARRVYTYDRHKLSRKAWRYY